MTVVQPSAGEMPEIADGLYPAVIAKVTQIKLEQPDQFGKTDKLKLMLDVEVDGEIVSLDPLVNIAWAENAKLFQIAQAAGLDPDPLDAFETDALIGRPVRVTVQTEPGKWPKVTQWMKASAPQGKKAPKHEHKEKFDPEDGEWKCSVCNVLMAEPPSTAD